MEPFAKPDDYAARYGEADDEAMLKELLCDATRKLASELDAAGIDYADPDPDYADKLMQACRDMAYRAVSAAGIPDVPVGAASVSRGANGFSESYSFGSDAGRVFGEVYTSKNERKLLGIDRQRIASLRPIVDGW